MARYRKILKFSEFGFSAVEMLVTLAIAGILGGTLVPQMSALRSAMNRMSARSYLLQDLKRAQAETIEQGCRGIFKIAADGSGYTFGCDYLAYDPAAVPTADGITFTRTLPQMITVGSDALVIFNSRGQSVDIDDVLVNINLELEDSQTGPTVFATGSLSGTGVFSYD